MPGLSGRGFEGGGAFDRMLPGRDLAALTGLAQAPGWQLTQPRPGTLAWTLPSGRSYTTEPDPYPV